MEGPRAPRYDEYTDVIRFLDTSLRPASGWSIQNEYPTAFTEQNLNNIRIIKDDTGVLSHAVLKPLIVKTPAAIIKAAAIGSVVTNTAYRSQGLSSKVIENCLEEAYRQECDIAILWTNIYDFYRKFGFELAGNETTLIINQPLSLDASSLRFKETNKIDPAAVLKLYNRHTVSTFRTVEEIKKYLQIPNSRVYSAWDQAGQLVAYAVEGKGADLDAHVHEWGGGVTELCQLLNFMYSRQKRPLTVMVPAHSVSLIQKLRLLGLDSHEGYLGMIKLINPEQLFKKISRHAKTDHGYTHFQMEVAKNSNGETEFLFGTKQSLFRTTSERDMVQLLFGPHRPSDISKFDDKTIDILNQLFPLRLWLWGWDSI